MQHSWAKTIPTVLESCTGQPTEGIGFKQTFSDPCLYVCVNSEEVMFLVAVYVDDIVLGGRSEAEMNAVQEELSQKFEMKYFGPLHHFIGVKVIQDQLAGVIWIGQPSFTEKILQKFSMYDCKPFSTPFNPDVKLVSSESPDEVCDQLMYVPTS